MTHPKFAFVETNVADSVAHPECSEFQELTKNGYTFIWEQTDDLFVDVDGQSLTFSVLNPAKGEEVKILQWDFAENSVVACRAWPGNVAIHFASDGPCIFASHISLLSQFNKKQRRAPKLIEPQMCVHFDLVTSEHQTNERSELPNVSEPISISEAALDLDAYLYEVIANVPKDTVLLLSGGVDSAGLASLAAGHGLRTLTWVLKQDHLDVRGLPDVKAAIAVAQHFDLEHEVFELDPNQLFSDAKAAVFLSEIKRGTLIDDMVVYIQVARHLQRQNVRHVLLGEAADDVFGCLPMNFRFYQGEELQAKLRKELLFGAPDDYAAISKLFSFFGITVIDPFLSPNVAALGASLPLTMRIDEQRTIKPVLRQAFAGVLPKWIAERKKEVSRDVSGVREVMQGKFGDSPHRFYQMHRAFFRDANCIEQQQHVLEHLNGFKNDGC